MALERESEVFQRELPRLLRSEENRGRFAIVHGDAVVQISATMDEALKTGYKLFGSDPFLVQEITDCESPAYFSRSVTRWES